MLAVIKNYKEDLYSKLVYKFSRLTRMGISANFIKGAGIEIGGLNYPLPVRPGVSVKYLDRISAEDHLNVLDEFERKDIVTVDIIDDGETLATVPDNSQDFIIANHFIEHTRNPILAIQNAIRTLKPGGVFFMAVPDKRYTFDVHRQVTTVEHLLRDYNEGPDWSEEDHYFDFVSKTDKSDGCKNDDDIRRVIRELKESNFSIHYHVWDHHAMLGLLMTLSDQHGFPFEIDFALAPQDGGNEAIYIMRKKQ
ncbi:MAG TPA: methyltransferase domain-containing protein [Puia sp.]